MAEIIGLTASVVQLVQFSGDILVAGYGFLSKVARAPAEMRDLLSESAGLNCVLGHLQTLVESPASPTDALHSLEKLGTFKECHALLVGIKRSLDACEQVHGKDLRNFGRKLVWPFKERETRDALQRLGRIRGLISSAIDNDSALALRRIEKGQAAMLNEVTDISTGLKVQISRDDFTKVTDWLCTLTEWNASESLQSALQVRHQGTGTWFLESTTFKSWTRNGNGLFWITGAPGSGKTVLCSTIIEHLRDSFRSPSTAILYFFCDHRVQQNLASRSFLMSLATQMVYQSENCFQYAQKLYREKTKDSERVLNTSEYASLVKVFFKEFDQTFVAVDALDEASDKAAIAHALKDMLGLSPKPSNNNIGDPAVKIILTSREDKSIQRILAPSGTEYSQLTLEKNSRADVEGYVRSEVQARILSREIKLRDPELATVIERTITDRAGTFLQARLQLDMISTLKTDKAIRMTLQTLPDGLTAIYESVLESTLEQYPTQVQDIKRILQWLVCCAEPLTASELAEIVAIGPEDKSLDLDGVPIDHEDVTEPISQLIALEHEGGDVIVQFSHFSIQEYLCGRKIAAGPLKDLHIDEEEAHALAAEICVQYLSFSDFNEPLSAGLASPTKHLNRELKTFSLLEYATLYWHYHLRMSNMTREAFAARMVPRLQWFLNSETQPNIFTHWQAMILMLKPDDKSSTHSPLCFAIRHGLRPIVDAMLPLLSNVNLVFPNGFTCLGAAASGSQVQIAKALLNRGADVDLPTGDRGQTPLHLAAENGDEEMVRFLLNAGASIYARSDSKTTPFYRAARSGNLNVLRLLYDKGSDINAKSWDGWTPLMEAVENGHAAAVKLLLGWGADPGICTRYGNTALGLAASYRSAPIQALLEAAVKIHGEAAANESRVDEPPDVDTGDCDSEDSDLETVFISY
ncbi:uncharacterized protein L3040_008869 [Drepanopeziza brunnea f. sp. 'multigermtubi']|uniref:NACHT domain-containing protein n=1 Tax=Marssonina brunnea f. sp. multigermtubi (strain MB_m1) TaxID=1072389 RepID=K1WI12_MARBU|nr:uncharacterized protein MBM_04802 [Drepanopeziza brunnea f. sp. 'multigermtubi' MB_m1]EKD17225.1 hypothetical protein MBM_04802 [Drepanopeziza brunnea f. sp. 'multigermtubi' MB_m1]KAJ5032261.1 hypothetical protein L3040_008869 [Drepanopeziza brunnea f. sp. 'multigermtubi']